MEESRSSTQQSNNHRRPSRWWFPKRFLSVFLCLPHFLSFSLSLFLFQFLAFTLSVSPTFYLSFSLSLLLSVCLSLFPYFLGLIYKLGLRKYGIMEESRSTTQPSSNHRRPSKWWNPKRFLSVFLCLSVSFHFLAFSLSVSSTCYLSFSLSLLLPVCPSLSPSFSYLLFFAFLGLFTRQG